MENIREKIKINGREFYGIKTINKILPSDDSIGSNRNAAKPQVYLSLFLDNDYERCYHKILTNKDAVETTNQEVLTELQELFS
jgi:hypothetical protein